MLFGSLLANWHYRVVAGRQFRGQAGLSDYRSVSANDLQAPLQCVGWANVPMQVAAFNSEPSSKIFSEATRVFVVSLRATQAVQSRL